MSSIQLFWNKIRCQYGTSKIKQNESFEQFIVNFAFSKGPIRFRHPRIMAGKTQTCSRGGVSRNLEESTRRDFSSMKKRADPPLSAIAHSKPSLFADRARPARTTYLYYTVHCLDVPDFTHVLSAISTRNSHPP